MVVDINKAFERKINSGKLAEKLKANWQNLNSLTHQEISLIETNRRMFNTLGKITERAIHLKNSEYKKSLVDFNDYKNIIGYFAYAGDLLCINIREYINDYNNINGPTASLALYYSKITEKILLRTIKQEEYFGILNGEIPFGHCAGEKFYLPKPKEKFSPTFS